MAASQWFKPILTALFPDRCLFCGEPVSPGVCCCPRCLEALPFAPPPDPRPGPAAPGADPDPFGWRTSPFLYTGGVRRAIAQLKFYGHREAAGFFAPYLARAVRACGGPDYRPDWVVPVPMAPQRLAQRGYNQAELLAAAAAELLGVRCRTDVLQRSGGLVQHELSARMRRLEARTSFTLAPGADPAGRRILLVDDIFTTGSTLDRCAWLLRDAGAAEVDGVTAAVTPRKTQQNVAFL